MNRRGAMTATKWLPYCKTHTSVAPCQGLAQFARWNHPMLSGTQSLLGTCQQKFGLKESHQATFLLVVWCVRLARRHTSWSSRTPQKQL